MLQNELIVCFATLSWDFLWLRHQELMTRFAQAGNRVLFIEPIGIRMPKWEDRGRILARVRNRRRADPRGVREIAPNVWGLDPLVNPLQQVGLIHRRNVNALSERVRAALEGLGDGRPIIWTCVPTPLARETIARIPHKLVIYDCMDALTENPKGVMASFAESERQLSREADLVLVTAPTLLERQRGLNPHTYLIPHGVNYELFTTEHGLRPEPAALAALPHPRLIFFGGIDERIDLELLAQLARNHPQWQLVLLGVTRTDISVLLQLPNVHFLGQIAHDALPAYLHHCDVFLLPYRRIGFSYYMNPAKLHECLAVGRPVVAMALPIFEQYREVLDVAETTAQFERLVVAALAAGQAADKVARRQACARQNTWEARFREVNERIEEQLRKGGATNG